MEMLKEIANTLANVKLQDIKIYETRSITPLFDYVINATATSSRQLNAVIDHLKKESHEKNYKIKGIEGSRGEIWLLVDLYDVLINVFLNEERDRYALDKLWADLPQFEFEKLLQKDV